MTEYGIWQRRGGDIRALLQLLSPFAPHIAEELWERQGFEGYASTSVWPAYDESKMTESEKEIAVQINGKLRATAVVPMDAEDGTVLEIVKSQEKVRKAMGGSLRKSIVVKNKLVNLILRPVR